VRAGWRCLLVIVGCWGCAGDLENPERFGFLLDGGTKMNAQGGIPAPPPCLTSLFETRCGTPGCHVANSTIQIDLVSPKVEERLLDKKPNGLSCKVGLLVATDGTDSLLLQKVQGSPPCGSAMPLNGKLSADELKCVSDWVKDVGDSKGGGS
jgi:hypothetical protein